MPNFPVTASDTGLTVTDSIRLDVTRPLSDDIFLQPFGAVTGVLDNFQRANESPLSGGGRWTRSGTFGSNLNLVSHATQAATTSQIDSESYVAAGDLYDCEVWAVINPIPYSGSADTVGVIIRQNPATASQKDCYILAYESDGTTLFLTYTDATGGDTLLGSWSVVLANGDSIGLRANGTTLTAYYKHGSGAWQVAGSVTDSSGVHGYLGIQQVTLSGIQSGVVTFGGGPIKLHDSIVPLRAPHGLFPDTGVTVTDSIQMAVSRPEPTDTGLTVTDAMVVFLNGKTLVGLTDNGLSLSDSIQKSHSTEMTDTGLGAITDSISSHPTRVRIPVDQGLTFSDTLGPKTVVKFIATTGLTVTDTPHRSYSATATTTGLTVTDSIQKTARKVISDTGLSIIDAPLVVRLNGHNTSVSLTDRGATISGSITMAVSRASVGYDPDTGLHITDGIRRTVTPPTHPVGPSADFTFSISGLTVTFTDTSTPGSAPIESWSWLFGDGATSSATNPTHTYSSDGTYIVRLTVTTIYGSSTISKPLTVSGTVGAGTHIDGVIF